jgi:hypothetical protein
MVASDRGIDALKIDDRTGEIQIQKGYTQTTINIAFAESGGSLFAATLQNGIIKLSGGAPTAQAWFDSTAEISKMSSSEDGELLALRSDGLWRIGIGFKRKTHLLLESADLIDYLKLEEGILLALHKDGAISTIDLRFEELLIPGIAGAITALSGNDSVIFVAQNSLIHLLDRQSGKLLQSYALVPGALSVAIEEMGDLIYIGTFDQGLAVLNKSTGNISYIGKNNGLPDQNVLSMAQLNDTLWVSTLGGLSAISGNGTIRSYDILDLIGPTYIYSLLAIDDGLLIGTDGRGIWKFSGKNFTSLFQNQEFEKESIYKLSKDGSGNIWFNTKNHGVFRWNIRNDSLKRFEPLPKDAGYTILEGTAGKWALEIGDGRMRILMDSTFLDFDQELGFKIIKGDYLNTAFRANDDVTYFSSGSRIYSYRHHAGVSMHPKPIITSRLVNLSPAASERSQLKPNENHISFSFDAIWYQYPKDVMFRYKLVGLDTSWTVTQGNTVVYPNLPHGEYSFIIETGHGLHFWNGNQDSSNFYIARPFYLTWWFLASIIIALALLITFIVRIRESRINKLRLAEQERLESELANLRNQVNPHFLFNSFNTLMNIIETKPGQASDYLQRLSDFYRKILEADQSPVVMLGEELENLDAYLYLQKKRFGDAIRLHINIPPEYFDSPIPSLTLQLLAENAIKHNVITRNKPLDLRMIIQEGSLFVTNEITPKNIQEPGMGIGLSNIAKRYKGLFGKEVVITKTNGNFTVKLPIIQNYHARIDT